MALREKILELTACGMRPSEIAKDLDIHITTVYYHTNEKIRRRMIDRLLDLKKENKRRAVELLGGKCQKCGYSRCLDALVFHHRNPHEKELVVSGSPHSWKKLENELTKTVLLCCLCHTELHAGHWTDGELSDLCLVYVPNGVNTGRGILPPSKRKHS